MPAFAGNRIGFKVLNEVAQLAEEHGVQLMDTLVGPYTGRAMAPLATVDLVGWDGSRDSDGNAMATYRVEGGLALPARVDLKLGYAHTGVHGPVPPVDEASGDADALYAVMGWQPTPRHRGELRLGATRLSDSTGGERTTGIGGLSYSFPMAGWTGRAVFARDPFLYSPLILDNAIDVTSLTFVLHPRDEPNRPRFPRAVARVWTSRRWNGRCP